MHVSSLYGPHVSVCTPDNQVRWWMVSTVDQRISELLDSLCCYFVALDASIHVSDVLNWIQVWGT